MNTIHTAPCSPMCTKEELPDTALLKRRQSIGVSYDQKK